MPSYGWVYAGFGMSEVEITVPVLFAQSLWCIFFNMKYFILSVLFFKIGIISAQESIQITKYYEDTYVPKPKEIYWVLTKDTTLKTGLYTSYFKAGKVSYTGNYLRGKRVGIWEFNDAATWEPYLKYDFDTDKEIFYKSTFKETEGEVYTVVGGKMIALDKGPYCPEFLPLSIVSFQNYIVTELNQNNILELTNSDCTLNIKIVITENGYLTSEPIRNDCNVNIINAIEKIIQNSPKWIPGESGGAKINCEFLLPFKLKKNAP